MTNSKFSITTSSKKVSNNDCDKDHNQKQQYDRPNRKYSCLWNFDRRHRHSNDRQHTGNSNMAAGYIHRLSVVVAIIHEHLSSNSPYTPGLPLGAFLPLSAIDVHKNRSTIRGLKIESQPAYPFIVISECVRINAQATMGHFTFWISLSLSVSLSPKFGLKPKISQKVKSFFCLRPNFGLSDR